VKAIGHTAYIRLWRAMIRERQGKPIARPYRWTGLSEKILGHSEYVRLWRQKSKQIMRRFDDKLKRETAGDFKRGAGISGLGCVGTSCRCQTRISAAKHL